MHSLQKDIRKDIIKHPYRNMEIIYEAGKMMLSAQDEELIKEYTRLHDFEQKMKSTAEQLHRQSESLNETILQLDEKLLSVRASFDTCVSLADKLSQANYSLMETSVEKVAKVQEQTQEKLKDYHKDLLAIYEIAKVMQEDINQYHEFNENGTETIYEEVYTLVMNHSANWENNAINTSDFDRQFNQFRKFATMMENRREFLVAESESVMDNYNNLNNETTALYNLWNELIKRTDLLARMSDLHNKTTGFTEN